jgi:hypothetical protein
MQLWYGTVWRVYMQQYQQSGRYNSVVDSIDGLYWIIIQ